MVARSEELAGDSKACTRAETALAEALGLRGEARASGAAVRPSLEWVRGWPIKPLALLLTKHDIVVNSLFLCYLLYLNFCARYRTCQRLTFACFKPQCVFHKSLGYNASIATGDA